ncbi:hypothetical protein Tco_1251145 [Tanacetum coccineum]
MGGSYYSFPCSILSTGKDCNTRNEILMGGSNNNKENLSLKHGIVSGLTLKSPTSHGIAILATKSNIYTMFQIPPQRRQPSINSGPSVVPTTLSTAWEIPSKLLLIIRPRIPMKWEASGLLLNPSKTILANTIDISGAHPSDMKNPREISKTRIQQFPITLSQNIQAGPFEFQNNKPEEEEQEEKDNLENINTNPSSPPNPSVSFVT